MEEFILCALKAHEQVHGPELSDTFELKLRRELGKASAGYSVYQNNEEVFSSNVTIPNLENLDSNLVEELSTVDVGSLTDEQALALAKRIGLMND